MPVYYAAGILAFARHPNGKALVLLGKDVRADAGYSDMGGKAEKSDKADVIGTACREFYEETCGLWSNPRSLRRFITPETAMLITGRTQNGFPYFSFLIEMPFIPALRFQYRKLVDFLHFRNLHRQLVEKTDLQFFCASKLFDDSFQKRSIFCATINANRCVLAEVVESLEKGENWRDICHRHTWDVDKLL